MFENFLNKFSLENKFISKLKKIESVKINSLKLSINNLSEFIKLLKSSQFQKIIKNRKNKNIKDYSFFEKCFKICENILHNNSKFLKVDFNNYISGGENVSKELFGLYYELFEHLKVENVQSSMVINKKHTNKLRNNIKSGFIISLNIMVLNYGKYYSFCKSRGDNIFGIKKYLDWMKYLQNKSKEIENMKIETFTKEYVCSVVDEILSRDVCTVPNIDDIIKELESFKTHPNFDSIRAYIEEVQKINMKSFDDNFVENINIITSDLEYILKILIKKYSLSKK